MNLLPYERFMQTIEIKDIPIDFRLAISNLLLADTDTSKTQKELIETRIKRFHPYRPFLSFYHDENDPLYCYKNYDKVNGEVCCSAYNLFLILKMTQQPYLADEIKNHYRTLFDHCGYGTPLRPAEVKRPEQPRLVTKTGFPDGKAAIPTSTLTCCVCLGENATILAYPCMHLSMCYGCTVELREKGKVDENTGLHKCANCRKDVEWFKCTFN